MKNISKLSTKKRKQTDYLGIRICLLKKQEYDTKSKYSKDEICIFGPISYESIDYTLNPPTMQVK